MKQIPRLLYKQIVRLMSKLQIPRFRQKFQDFVKKNSKTVLSKFQNFKQIVKPY